MYHCEVLADSNNLVTGDRLTTFLVTFPRMVLADMTRHRCLSYSFESTRAVPVEARIKMVRENPFVPRMRRKVKGMAQGEFLVGGELRSAEWQWRHAALQAANAAQGLLDVEKGIAGRLLEPFSWITGIVSGTEWENFFNLRCHPAAQYELQVIAEMMRDARLASTPVGLAIGEWHLPLIADEERGDHTGRELAAGSAGRCAAISYLKHRVDEHLVTSQHRWHTKLQPFHHWSPAEHPAVAVYKASDLGNYGSGFKQLRKMYPGNEVAHP